MVPLKVVADITLGKMVQPEPSSDADIEAPYLRAAHVQPNGQLIEPEEKTMWFAPKELRQLTLKRGDVVIVEGGAGFGRSAYLTSDFNGWGFQNSIIRLRPRLRLADGRFLNYVLQDMLSTGETALAASVATIPHFTAEKVAAVRHRIPEAPEQRLIADFLDRETAQIDAMIEAQRDLVAGLDERRQGVASRMLLCVPEGVERSNGWLAGTPHPVERLGLHVKVTNGSTPSRENLEYWDGHYPWLNSSVANLAYVDEALEGVTALALLECHLPKVPAGALLVAITGQGKTRGKATELRIEATINQHLAAIIPSEVHWNARFLLHVLRAAYGELRRISDEGGSTKGAITCEDLKRFPVPRPGLVEQTRCTAEFERVAARMDAMIDAANESIALMRERRSALISAAVTGRIDPRTGMERAVSV